MSEWITCTLGEVAEFIQTGPFGAQLHQSDYSDKGIPVVMPQDMDGGRIVTTNIARVEAHHVERLKRHKLQEGDIVYSRRGDVGRSGYVSENQSGWLCGTGCLLVRLDKTKVYPRFIAYYLRQESQVAWVENNAVGITMLNLNTGILAAAPLRIPSSIEEQKRIADELTAIDAKIEHNNELIKMLEEQAQLVYDYWFMQFDFPDENGKPYRSSGGKMVWNDKLKREIPEGWKIAGIDRFLTLTRGVSYKPTDASDIPTPMHTCILRANNIDFGTIRWDGLVYVKTERVNQKTQRLKENDIVIVMSSGSKEHVGKTATAWGDLDCSYGAFCAKITPHEQCTSYVRTSLRSSTFRAFLKKQLLATNINNISLSVLANYIVPEPTYNVLERFQQITGEIYTRCNTLHAEIYELTKQRDFLLPLLMSGQVKVAE